MCAGAVNLGGIFKKGRETHPFVGAIIKNLGKIAMFYIRPPNIVNVPKAAKISVWHPAKQPNRHKHVVSVISL